MNSRHTLCHTGLLPSSSRPSSFHTICLPIGFACEISNLQCTVTSTKRRVNKAPSLFGVVSYLYMCSIKKLCSYGKSKSFSKSARTACHSVVPADTLLAYATRESGKILSTHLSENQCS